MHEKRVMYLGVGVICAIGVAAVGLYSYTSCLGQERADSGGVRSSLATQSAATRPAEGKLRMDGLKQVRAGVDEVLAAQADVKLRRDGFVHLYGVAEACALLALRRGVDPQLAAAAGMLHDISRYKTGDLTDHCNRSAAMAREILMATAAYTPEQVESICDAIAVHDEKDSTHTPLGEVLKDADLVQPYLYDPARRASKPKHPRLIAAMKELGIQL